MDNRTMMQYFEWELPADGLLWQRLAAQAPAIKKQGIDVVWLPPAYKGAGGQSDRGYGVYDMYDLGEFDQKGSIPTKYGTRREYLDAIRAAQRNGVSVVADVVLNQRLGADETELVLADPVDPNNRTQTMGPQRNIRAWTKFICPGRAGKYSQFDWDWQCFTGVDYDEEAHQPGIYRFRGKEWSDKVSHELGNYDYLMGADVDMAHNEVREELKRWGKWYLKTTGVNGLRLDAVKHIDREFVREWLDTMRVDCGAGLETVGEYWSEDLGQLKEFLQGCDHCLSLFDVPLHFNFMRASQGRGGFDMAKLLEGALVAHEQYNAVTFVDNHDSQPGQALESWVEPWFKPLAYAVILLREHGLPCVFYADYYGMRGDAVPAVPGIKRMLQVRRHYAYGAQHDYFDHPNVVGWTREGDGEHPDSGCAVILTDGDGGEKTMYVGRQHAGRRFRDVIRRLQEPVTIGEDGNAVFRVQGGGVSVWITEEAYKEIVVHFE